VTEISQSTERQCSAIKSKAVQDRRSPPTFWRHA